MNEFSCLHGNERYGACDDASTVITSIGFCSPKSRAQQMIMRLALSFRGTGAHTGDVGIRPPKQQKWQGSQRIRIEARPSGRAPFVGRSTPRIAFTFPSSPALRRM